MLRISIDHVRSTHFFQENGNKKALTLRFRKSYLKFLGHTIREKCLQIFFYSHKLMMAVGAEETTSILTEVFSL